MRVLFRTVCGVLLIHAAVFSDTRWTYLSFGPMLHLNFGDEKKVWSFAWEFAYWNYRVENNSGWFVEPAQGEPGYGIDIGIEFENRKTRLYCEPQLGFGGAAGIAAGPVLELEKGVSPKFGMQGSIWANWVAGVDLRYRYVNGENWVAPGLYGKLFLAVMSPSLPD